MNTTITTSTKLSGEQRTQINQGMNKGIDKLRSTGWKIDHVNKLGEIVVRNSGDANEVITYLSKHPAIAKYVEFNI